MLDPLTAFLNVQYVLHSTAKYFRPNRYKISLLSLKDPPVGSLDIIISNKRIKRHSSDCTGLHLCCLLTPNTGFITSRPK